MYVRKARKLNAIRKRNCRKRFRILSVCGLRCSVGFVNLRLPFRRPPYRDDTSLSRIISSATVTNSSLGRGGPAKNRVTHREESSCFPLHANDTSVRFTAELRSFCSPAQSKCTVTEIDIRADYFYVRNVER